MKQLIATTLIEPSTLFREGLRQILSSTRFRPIRTARCVEDLPNEAFSRPRPALFIIGTGDDRDATLDAIRCVKEKSPTIHVVVLGSRLEPEDIGLALQAGANGFLLKSTTCEVLIKSLELVMLGETVVPTALFRFAGDHSEKAVGLPAITSTANGNGMPNGGVHHKIRGLSARETAILRHLMQGASNKLIARTCEITEATVKVHVKAILRKIRVSNRTQAAMWAANHLQDAREAMPGALNGSSPDEIAKGA